MGKKRHSHKLGSSKRTTKNRNKKTKKLLKKIQKSKIQLGIEELCTGQSNLANTEPQQTATLRFLSSSCSLSSSAIDRTFKRSKRKVIKPKTKLARKKESRLCSLLSNLSCDSEEKKREEELCKLLNPFKLDSDTPGPSKDVSAPGLLYTAQDAQAFRRKVKSYKQRRDSDSDD